MSDFEANVRARSDANIAVMLERHKKYGPKNIADAPGGPLNGLRVRMHDKLARINFAIDTYAEWSLNPEYGGSAVDFIDDPFADAWLDLSNYPLIGQMVLEGTWPR